MGPRESQMVSGQKGNTVLLNLHWPLVPLVTTHSLASLVMPLGSCQFTALRRRTLIIDKQFQADNRRPTTGHNQVVGDLLTRQPIDMYIE